MGADQSRTRARRPKALGACLVAVLMVGVGSPATLIATASASHATQSQSRPKTVSQCEQKFGPGSNTRAACIRRVRNEKPGTSCKHPLASGISAAGPAGDLKDVGVKRLILSETHPGEPREGDFTTFKVEVTRHNPRAVMCSLTVSEFRESTATPGRIERGKVYHLTIGPQGGVSSAVTVPANVVVVPVVRFRLR